MDGKPYPGYLCRIATDEGGLTTFEGAALGASGTGLNALVSLAGGLAMTGTLAAPYSLSRLGGTWMR